MHVGPYLFFNGRCEEAIDFYRDALGAQVDAIMRFKDAPDSAGVPPGRADQVMHACFRIGDSAIMASDGCGEVPDFNGFALSITAADEAEADRLFSALADGGKVQMPLEKTFFSPRFGMVADRFGASWMVIVMPRDGN